MKRRSSRALAGLLLLGLSAPLRAVIFYSTGDPAYNTTPPTGSLAGSGWQWEGIWGAVAGTPIGPHHFIASRHVNGGVGDPFVFHGVSYVTTACFDDNASDLRIWRVAGTFPTWASLYRGSDEVGKPLVVYGRGLSRGSEVRVDGKLKGWMWGEGNGPLRWGQDIVGAISDLGAGSGQVLRVFFNPRMGSNAAALGSNDSSGAVFIREWGSWHLAGINSTVDASFNYTNTGSGFIAALFDMSGLYVGNTGGWRRCPYRVPSSFYATRISARRAWIDSIVPPLPAPNPAQP